MNWPLYPDYLLKTSYLYYRTFPVLPNFPSIPFSTFRNTVLTNILRFTFQFASFSEVKNRAPFEAHLDMAEQIFFWAQQLTQQSNVSYSQSLNLVVAIVSLTYLFEKALFLKLNLKSLYHLCIALFLSYNLSSEGFETFFKTVNFNANTPSISCFANFDFSAIINE